MWEIKRKRQIHRKPQSHDPHINPLWLTLCLRSNFCLRSPAADFSQASVFRPLTHLFRDRRLCSLQGPKLLEMTVIFFSLSLSRVHSQFLWQQTKEITMTASFMCWRIVAWFSPIVFVLDSQAFSSFSKWVSQKNTTKGNNTFAVEICCCTLSMVYLTTKHNTKEHNSLTLKPVGITKEKDEEWTVVSCKDHHGPSCFTIVGWCEDGVRRTAVVPAYEKSTWLG